MTNDIKYNLIIWGSDKDAFEIYTCINDKAEVLYVVDDNIKNKAWDVVSAISSDSISKIDYDYVIIPESINHCELCDRYQIDEKKVIRGFDLKNKYVFFNYFLVAMKLEKLYDELYKKNETENARMNIERSWYESEKQLYNEEKAKILNEANRYEVEVAKIEKEREWYEEEKKFFLNERNIYNSKLEQMNGAIARIEKEREWYEEEKKNFLNEIYEKNGVIADLNNKLKYEIQRACLAKKMGIFEYSKPQIKMETSENLLKRVISEKKSLVRFGDGEFDLILGSERAWFQDINTTLSGQLKQVLNSDNDQVLVAIADDFNNLNKYTDDAANAIREYLDNGKREKILELLDLDRLYYDAYVSRPYIMYEDKSRAISIFNLFKEVWKNRNILIVEGEYMHTGDNNDLFDTANSVRRIICPSKNAYDYYDEIKDSVINNYKANDLVLIGLGATATVLAYDLTVNASMQVIDLGQIDNEYEWYNMKAEKRESIEGKAVPELNERKVENVSVSDKYYSEIVKKIGCR